MAFYMTPAGAKPQIPERDLEYFFVALAETAPMSEAQHPASALGAALAAYRMACTNLPTDPVAVDVTRTALDAALEPLGVLPRIRSRWERRIDSLARDAAEAAAQPSYKQKSCYVMQGMHQIVERLYVGSYHPANDADLLRQAGVTHVCCCINVAPRHPGKFKYIVLPADDTPQYDISKHFDETFNFIDAALSQTTGAVLVHCGAGISRAPTIAAAYLIRKLGISTEEAVGMIKRRRSCASPNQGFMRHLRMLADAQQALRRSGYSSSSSRSAASSAGSSPLAGTPKAGAPGRPPRMPSTPPSPSRIGSLTAAPATPVRPAVPPVPCS